MKAKGTKKPKFYVISEVGSNGTRIEPKTEYDYRVEKEQKVEDFVRTLILTNEVPTHIRNAVHAITLPIMAIDLQVNDQNSLAGLTTIFAKNVESAEALEDFKSVPDSTSKAIEVLMWHVRRFIDCERDHGFEGAVSLNEFFYKVFLSEMYLMPTGIIGLITKTAFDIEEHDSIMCDRIRNENGW